MYGWVWVNISVEGLGYPDGQGTEPIHRCPYLKQGRGLPDWWRIIFLWSRSSASIARRRKLKIQFEFMPDLKLVIPVPPPRHASWQPSTTFEEKQRGPKVEKELPSIPNETYVSLVSALPSSPISVPVASSPISAVPTASIPNISISKSGPLRKTLKSSVPVRSHSLDISAQTGGTRGSRAPRNSRGSKKLEKLDSLMMMVSDFSFD